MSNFLFSGRPTRKSGSRQPNQYESICIGCHNTFNINTLKMNDGKRCSRCFDKYIYSKGGNVYDNPNKYGFYKMNRDVSHDVDDSELISDEEEIVDEINDDESENEEEDSNEELEESDDYEESEEESDENDDDTDTEYDGDNLTEMEKAIEQAPKRRRIY